MRDYGVGRECPSTGQDGFEPTGSSVRQCRGRVGVETDEAVVVADGFLVVVQPRAEVGPLEM